MNTLKRIASGTIAGWTRVLIAMLAQLVTVPVLMRHWDAETLGIWFAMQSSLALAQILDSVHQNYLEGEFFKVGYVSQDTLYRIFSDGIPVVIGISLLQFLGISWMVYGGYYTWAVGAVDSNRESVFACELFAVGNAFIWLVSGGIGGLAVRVLGASGHFARFAWWGVVNAGVTSLAVLPVAILGGNLLHIVIAFMSGYAVVNAMTWIDIIRVFRKNNYRLVYPRLKSGLKRFCFSLTLLIPFFSEIFRQHGIRLVLAPLAGAIEVANFSAVRTGANLALQGLNTITSPMIPEMMRLMSLKEKVKVEIIPILFWFIILAAVTPALVLAQLVAQPVFNWWTNEKIPFDPTLFGFFSISILFYSLSQPAAAVIRGNNLVRMQLITSIIVTAWIVTSLPLMVSYFGLSGAAFGLAVAEIIHCIAMTIGAATWMKTVGYCWPWMHFLLSISCVLLTGVLLFAVATQKLNVLLKIFPGLILPFAILWYVWILPIAAKSQLLRILKSYTA